MSLDYAEGRIKEALRLTGGNVSLARQQIIAWTYEDAKLLHSLTKHHLSGIVAYHVERVDSGRGMKARMAGKPASSAATARKAAPPKKTEGDFGRDILEAAIGASGPVFGLEGYDETRTRGKASQTHVDAIRQLAAKSGTRTRKPDKK